jgi:hypothetical protein
MPHTFFALVLLIGSLATGMPWTSAGGLTGAGNKAGGQWDPDGAPSPQAGDKAGGIWDPNGTPEPQGGDKAGGKWDPNGAPEPQT